MWNYLDLFSGIGGFHLGLLMAGFKFDWVGYSDNYEYANKAYKKRFPDAIELGDITKINPNKLPLIDIITAGFPCQDISVAGKREGIKGERSGLFYEITRIAGVVRPRIILLENVPNLLSGESGEWMRCVLTALAEIGYDAEWQVISARFVGARHLRKRVWIIAYPKFNGRNETGKSEQSETLGKEKGYVSKEGNKLSSSIEYLGSDVSHSKRNRRAAGSINRCKETEKGGKIQRMRKSDSDNIGQICENVSDSECERLERISDTNNTKTTRQRKNSRKIFTKSESKRFDFLCSKDWWTVEPELGRVAYGIFNRMDRLKCIGNAVVPQVVAFVGKLILKGGILK